MVCLRCLAAAGDPTTCTLSIGAAAVTMTLANPFQALESLCDALSQRWCDRATTATAVFEQDGGYHQLDLTGIVPDNLQIRVVECLEFGNHGPSEHVTLEADCGLLEMVEAVQAELERIQSEPQILEALQLSDEVVTTLRTLLRVCTCSFGPGHCRRRGVAGLRLCPYCDDAPLHAHCARCGEPVREQPRPGLFCSSCSGELEPAGSKAGAGA